MVKVSIDETHFGPNANSLPPEIKIALWDFVKRAAENPDDPDLERSERDGIRASQFTSGWVLYWEVIRKKAGYLLSLRSGAPVKIMLWDVRRI